MVNQLVNTSENLLSGMLLAIFLSGIVLLICAITNRRKKLHLLSFVFALLLCPGLSYQMSRMIGAWNLYDIACDAESVANTIGGFSSLLGDAVGNITRISKEEIGWFIFRRCMWSLGFMAVGFIAIYYTMKVKYRGHGAYVDYDSSSTTSTNEFGF